MYLRLSVAEEVFSMPAVSHPEEIMATFQQGATEPPIHTAIVIVLLFSTYPQPLITQVTQSSPHLPTYNKET